MTTERVEHWERKLLETVEAARARAFRWGEHDCVTFAAECVAAITGVDPLADLPPWSSAREALHVIGEVGGLDVALTERFGAPIAPVFAQRGDLGLLKPSHSSHTGVTVAVCIGEWWLVPSESGMGRVGVEEVDAAWRVGR